MAGLDEARYPDAGSENPGRQPVLEVDGDDAFLRHVCSRQYGGLTTAQPFMKIIKGRERTQQPRPVWKENI